MPRMLFGARKLRLEAQLRTGEALSMQKAADGITAKMRAISGDASAEMGRARLNNYELGKIFEAKTLELVGICAYYSEILGRAVNTQEILEFDPNSKRVGEPVFA